MCNCFGDKKEDEDEEGLYTDSERDNDDELNNMEEGVLSPLDDDDLPPAVDDLPPNDIPDVVVTMSAFEPERKSKRKQFKSMFKKKKNKATENGHVRFDASASETTSLVSESPQSSNYGIGLMPLKRSDSMESFMSGISSVTTNAEEFGEELSPARLQVFIQYDSKRWSLTAGAKQADCLITTNKETMYWQVHMTLCPFKKKRFKTRYKSSATPVFNQTFEIENIALQALPQLSLRFECTVELVAQVVKRWPVNVTFN